MESNPGPAQVITFLHLFIIGIFIGVISSLRAGITPRPFFPDPRWSQSMCPGVEGDLLPHLPAGTPIPGNTHGDPLSIRLEKKSEYKDLLEGFWNLPGLHSLLVPHPFTGLFCYLWLISSKTGAFPFYPSSFKIHISSWEMPHTNYIQLIESSPFLWYIFTSQPKLSPYHIPLP